jgi:all-trans-retinol 13,14-reductase
MIACQSNKKCQLSFSLLGASYPIGGASEIPYRIVPVIERAGGRVLMKAPVSQILTENGRVTGVRVGNKESSAVDIFAPIVISDAGIESSCKFLISIVLGENERHGNKNENIHNKSESIKSIIDYLSCKGIHNTFMDLLPENVAKMSPTWPLTNSMKPGIGCLSVFIGLRGTAEELGLKAENLWVFTDSSVEEVSRSYSLAFQMTNGIYSFYK